MNVELSTSSIRPTYHPISKRWALTRETVEIVQSHVHIVTMSHRSSTERGFLRASTSSAPNARSSNATTTALDAGNNRPFSTSAGSQSCPAVINNVIAAAPLTQIKIDETIGCRALPYGCCVFL